MNMIQPYLFFEGRCDEALAFYRDAIGAETTMRMTYGESPDQSMGNPAMKDKVMHASFRVGEATLMASDGNCAGQTNFHGFGLSLPARDPADAERLFNALAAGGQVMVPLAKTFFSPSFGMVTDRFGVMWMVMVPQAQ
jgi:PhnB protein